MRVFSVYGNGDINGAAVRLLLIPRILKSWEMVLQEITEKIAFRTGQACRKYAYTLRDRFHFDAVIFIRSNPSGSLNLREYKKLINNVFAFSTSRHHIAKSQLHSDPHNPLIRATFSL